MSVKDVLKEGERSFLRGDIEKAKYYFNEVLKCDPQNVDALNNMGVICFQEENAKDAILIFRKVLEIDSNHIDSWDNLIHCLCESGNYHEAALLYEKKLATDVKDIKTYLGYADCLTKANKPDAARRVLEMAQAIFGDHDDITCMLSEIALLCEKLNGSNGAKGTALRYECDTGDHNKHTAESKKQQGYVPRNVTHRSVRAGKLKRFPTAVLSASDLLEKDPSRRLRWGDHWFARDLAAALESYGAVISNENPRILFHLHGVPLQSVNMPTYNIVWLHSHPDMISAQTLSIYDHIYCLSPRFIKNIEAMGYKAELLVGGTAKQRPNPPPEISHGIVFVGNGKKGNGRKIIRDILALGSHWIDCLEVWGEGWNGILPRKCIRGIYFDNKKLDALYASSRVVLNDHHEDMLREGFLNPRILDVMASGGVVVSDALSTSHDLFGDALITYETLDDLDRILTTLFEDDSYRNEMVAAGMKAVEPYHFNNVAEKIVRHISSIDEEKLDNRFKNHYMRTIWAPVRGKLDTDRVRRLKKVSAEQCEGKTLDVGCANGDSTAIMRSHNPHLDLTGIELTAWGVQEASRNHPGMTFIQGNAKRLPFKDRAFDTVLLDHIIEHFTDPVPLIIEAKRVARKRVVIGIPIMHMNDPDHKIAWRVDDFKNFLLGFFPRFSLRGMREPDSVETTNQSEWKFVVATGYLDEGNRKDVTCNGPLRLHLGCGNQHFDGFINIDIMPSPSVDLLCDCKRLPFPAGSVQRIETYHMIEHLPRHEFIEALFEWNRVLEDGGMLIIECPDFPAIIKEYLDGKHHRINNIFGLQRHGGDFHHFGYSFDDLKRKLEAVGFGTVRQEAPTDYHAADEPSMRIIAVKEMAVERPSDVRTTSIVATQREYAQKLEQEKRSSH